jgi:squalene-hopene/tetraprenyl-beta-curcumene cyclase
MFETRRLAAVLCCAVYAASAALTMADEPPSFTEPTRQRARAAVAKGLTFLKATQQAEGAWQHAGQDDPAITALAAKCFAGQTGDPEARAIAERAVTRILTFKQPDGGIYPPAAGLMNYYTSVCLMALSSADAQRHAADILQAQTFLKKQQWDEGESIDQSNTWYGGAGYGKSKRPDLSNTQMMLEALRASGLPPEDPAYQKALKFVERCQMKSDSNDQTFARGAEDGGFIYTPVDGGESKAGTIAIDGAPPRLRSYGSMTYSGFKSYLYANLDRTDPRVTAAFDWICKNYTLEQNPNMPGQQSREGLYYYYHVFARALQTWGQPVIVDGQGRPHNWREELCNKLADLQNPDGSWINNADRWFEGNPQLVTSYAVLALQTALQE